MSRSPEPGKEPLVWVAILAIGAGFIVLVSAIAAGGLFR